MAFNFMAAVRTQQFFFFYSIFIEVLLYIIVHVCALSHFSPVQLFNSVDCSPSGCCIHGILQARILKWVAVPSFRGSPRPRDGTCVSYSSAFQADSLLLSQLMDTVW